MADSNEFVSQVKLQFENLEELQQQLTAAVESAMDQGGEMSKLMTKNFEGLKTKWQDLSGLMKKASSETDFKEAQNAMGVIAGNANRVANALQRSNSANILDAGKAKAAARGMMELARAQEANAKATIKTSLASQNVLRIIQDAPFGMFGIANNLEQMAESLGRLFQQTGSLGGALKATFMPLVTGPMALPLIVSLITAVSLSYDKLGKALDFVKVKLGLITEAQAEFNAEVAKLEKEGVKKIADAVPVEELAMAINNARDAFENATAKMKKEGESFSDAFGFTYGAATAKINEFNEANSAAMKTAGTALEPNKDVLAAMSAVSSEIGKRIKDAQKNADDISKFIDILEKKDILNLNEQQLRASLGQGIFDDDAPADKPDKKKKVKSIEDAAIQFRIDAMEEGLPKVIAQIRLNAKKERAAMIEEFGKREDLMKLIDAKEQSLILQETEKARDKILKENDKKITEDAQMARQRAKERERAILAAMKSETSAVMFGLEEKAMNVRAKVGDLDPFAFETEQVRVAGENQVKEVENRRRELGILLDNELIDKKSANAELRSLAAEEVAIQAETADKIKRIQEAKKSAILGIHRETLGAVSDLFGSLNTLSAKEGEKGLEESKKFLFAQAAAEAIASGISAYQSIMSMKGVPFPVKAVAAGAQMAAITARLMAAARSIKQIGKNGGASSAGVATGGFIQLNSSVTGQRVANFNRQQAGDSTRTSNADVVAAVNDVSREIGGINKRPLNVNVMLSDRGSAGIVTAGSEFNQRHTGRTSGSQVGS